MVCHPPEFKLVLLARLQITGGKSRSVATLSGIPVKDQTTDLCTDLAKEGADCPVPAGDLLLQDTETISGVPAGVLHVQYC